MKSLVLSMLGLPAGLMLKYRHIWHEAVGATHLKRIKNRGTGCRIKGDGTIFGYDQLKLGNSVAIGKRFFIVARGGVEIGDHSILSRNVVVQSQTHEYEAESLPYGKAMIRKPIKIGRAVWIGMNAKILPGVTIGDGAIIGLGAVCSKDVPKCGIAVGNPARVVKHRSLEHFDQLIQEEKFVN